MYGVDTVSLTNYSRSGANRYGSPSELTNTVQTLQLTQDKAWTFTIDKLNRAQSMMVMDAGKAIARQTRLVNIPYVDAYTFRKMAVAAQTAGNKDTTTATKSNAYSLLLQAQENMDDANVPEEGRVYLVTPTFAGLLKQDTAFVRDCDIGQNMLIKGMIGMIDGARIIKVPSSRLPADGSGNKCSFIGAHPLATVAPQILNEYKIHTDAPGISGWSAA